MQPSSEQSSLLIKSTAIKKPSIYETTNDQIPQQSLDLIYQLINIYYEEQHNTYAVQFAHLESDAFRDLKPDVQKHLRFESIFYTGYSGSPYSSNHYRYVTSFQGEKVMSSFLQMPLSKLSQEQITNYEKQRISDGIKIKSQDKMSPIIRESSTNGKAVKNKNQSGIINKEGKVITGLISLKQKYYRLKEKTGKLKDQNKKIVFSEKKIKVQQKSQKNIKTTEQNIKTTKLSQIEKSLHETKPQDQEEDQEFRYFSIQNTQNVLIQMNLGQGKMIFYQTFDTKLQQENQKHNQTDQSIVMNQKKIDQSNTIAQVDKDQRQQNLQQIQQKGQEVIGQLDFQKEWIFMESICFNSLIQNKDFKEQIANFDEIYDEHLSSIKKIQGVVTLKTLYGELTLIFYDLSQYHIWNDILNQKCIKYDFRGHYDIFSHLGEGAFAKVYKVRKKVEEIRIKRSSTQDQRNQIWSHLQQNQQNQSLIQAQNSSTPQNQQGISKLIAQQQSINRILNLHTMEQSSPFVQDNQDVDMFRAVKVINKEEQVKRDMISSLVQEIELLRSLNHPNIVKVVEIYESLRSIYIVLEYCQGGPILGQQIKFKVPSSDKETMIIMKQSLEALNYLKSKGIMHRDIKPDNVIWKYSTQTHPPIQGKNVLKFVDFGLAQNFLSSPFLMIRCGTPGYMAPEIYQASMNSSKRNPYDAQCDIFSLGVILFIALTGQKPFKGKDKAQTLALNKKAVYKVPEKIKLNETQQLLLDGMLKYESDQRLTVKQALKSEFFDEMEQVADEHINFINLNQLQGIMGQPQNPQKTELLKNFSIVNAHDKSYTIAYQAAQVRVEQQNFTVTLQSNNNISYMQASQCSPMTQPRFSNLLDLQMNIHSFEPKEGYLYNQGRRERSISQPKRIMPKNNIKRKKLKPPTSQKPFQDVSLDQSIPLKGLDQIKVKTQKDSPKIQTKNSQDYSMYKGTQTLNPQMLTEKDLKINKSGISVSVQQCQEELRSYSVHSSNFAIHTLKSYKTKPKNMKSSKFINSKHEIEKDENSVGIEIYEDEPMDESNNVEQIHQKQKMQDMQKRIKLDTSKRSSGLSQQKVIYQQNYEKKVQEKQQVQQYGDLKIKIQNEHKLDNSSQSNNVNKK